ncbi:DNA-directed RNA polymerase III subunit RPC4 [Cimex lectularius]|uniref:DNA-directed RNA polymerase III subunit RPC4 n=1 Tax=Cimex lectularius TaxID=79782 RepID=A0A8I6RS57_CIMLE|nr:DNA-directed RNA polymerase III subunit RPC4 [Cimex lectularius]XP_014249021.1 DNA-directed RNA polymerase III subunit RPC4 [Cimex lectularius]
MPGDQAPRVSVKAEVQAAYKRLPSFRTPRDLKLSEFRDIVANPLGESKTRKVFVPNLNVTRKKAEEKDGKQEDKTNVNGKPSVPGPVPARGAERGRGRGRRNPNFVQNSGIFSEGLAPTIKSSGWRSNTSSSEASNFMPKPKIKLNAHVKVDKEEEEKVMKELLCDDFIDDPEFKPDLEYCPIQLPLQECKLTVKEEEPVIKKLEKPIETLPNGVKIKQEPGVEPAENGLEIEEKPFDLNQLKPLTISQLMTSSSEKNFVFLQIPTCVPGLKLDNQYKTTGQKNDEESEKYVLRTLPTGRIGTLQIRKSGRTRLLLGDVKLSVDPATQASFRQDLISVNLNEDIKEGNMVNLGRVATRLLVTPEWESLL